MAVYFIGDTHFGHTNIIKLNNRPFQSITEMNNQMRKNWNDRVTDSDDIYILGDFWYKGMDDAVAFIRTLKGRKHLIVGNHDVKALKNPKFVAEFTSIKDICKIILDSTQIILCHYPLLEWDGYFRDSWHIHGHIHNNKNGAFNFLKNEQRALNAGVDITGFRPVTFAELKELNGLFKSAA